MPETDLLEADRIFQALFNTRPPTTLVERYERASVALFAELPESERKSCSRLIENVSDLEAVELAARLTGRLPLLRAKFRLLVALAECEPSLRPNFVNAQNRPFTAVVCLFGHGLRSLVKLLKGLWLIKRHLEVKNG